MDNERIDERIREMAKRESLQINSRFEERIDEILDSLNNTHPLRFKKAIVVASMILLILSATTVVTVATVQYYKNRMASMSEDEKEGLYNDIQNSTANADSYSRMLTKEEQKRMEILREAYEKEGRFPNNKVVEIENEDERMKDKICFESKTSTLYLPDRALTDEELLQIIDFYYKRDYSLSKVDTIEENEDSLTENENLPSNGKLNKKTAIKTAIEWVRIIYNIDASAYKSKIKRIDNDSFYSVDLTGPDSLLAFLVNVDRKTGKLSEIIAFNKEKEVCKDGIVLKEKELKQRYHSMKDLLYQKILDEGELSSSYLEYDLAKDGKTSYKGEVRYSFEMKDGSGCVIWYSLNMDMAYHIWIIQDFKIYKELCKMDKEKREKNEYLKELGLTSKVLQME